MHFVASGREGPRLHVAGFPRFRADQVVFFTTKGAKEQGTLTEISAKLGVPSKEVAVDGGYLDSYLKASFEAAAAFTRGDSIGVNMSVGPDVVRAAIEDATRVQLYHFLHHTSTEETSVFRYFTSGGDSSALAVPMWDFATYIHNDIFEILATTDHPITLRQVHVTLSKAMGREAPTWEAFRKTFREFKRCYKGSPSFVEVVGKGPRYQIRV